MPRRSRRNGGLGSLKKQVKELIKETAKDVHKVDVSYATNPLVATPTIQTFTPLAAGSDETQRIGNNIQIQSLSLKGYLVGGTTANNVVRVMVFKWLPDGVADGPTLAKMFTSTSNITSSSNTDRRRDYVILYDQFIDFITGQEQGKFDMYKKIQTKHSNVAFSATGAGDLAQGQFYVLIWPDAAATGPTAVFTLGARYMV